MLLPDMYYSLTCKNCGKVFYTYNDDRELAAETLYEGIEQHLKDYHESEDTSFYHDVNLDTNRIYDQMEELEDAPSDGYQL